MCFLYRSGLYKHFYKQKYAYISDVNKPRHVSDNRAFCDLSSTCHIRAPLFERIKAIQYIDTSLIEMIHFRDYFFVPPVQLSLTLHYCALYVMIGHVLQFSIFL